MNKKTYSQILDRVARDHVPEGTDLAPRILARIQKGKITAMQPRTKKFVTAVLVLLVLMIVLANVPAVRAAIQRWIGYAPGVGLISEGQVRVLAEPVSITREGITLTVEEAYELRDMAYNAGKVDIARALEARINALPSPGEKWKDYDGTFTILTTVRHGEKAFVVLISAARGASPKILPLTEVLERMVRQ